MSSVINEYNLIKYSRRISNNVRNNKKNENKDLNSNSFEQISLKENITKPKYEDSNIISFLSFLNNTICIPKNLRIVSHSHIMQKLIDDLNIVPNNDIINILNENLWSIFMSLNNGKKISISKHGFSFANLIDKKKTFYSKSEQIIEKDAKLSLYGILTSLLHGSDLVEKENSYGMTEKPQTIFVSTLIRTWMTAICLYLPHCDNDNFTLVVSPFIKEKGTELDNIPNSFENQIKTMQKFLKYLIKISDLKFSNAIINENLLKIKNYFIVKRFNLIVYARYPATMMYGEKTVEVEFHYRDKLGLSYFHNISKNENYFNKYCLQYKTFDIDNIKIFHGKVKPLKENIETKFTKWCEPFCLHDNFHDPKILCKYKLNSNLKDNKKNVVFNNNKINLISNKNLIPRETLYKRPNENLNFLKE